MSGVDQIMKLADEWYAHGQTSHSGIDEKYAALRAAVEQIVRERDELIHDIERHLRIASEEAERAERAEADAAALRAVYVKAREMFEQATISVDQFMRPRIDPPDYLQALERAVADTARALGE